MSDADRRDSRKAVPVGSDIVTSDDQPQTGDVSSEVEPSPSVVPPDEESSAKLADPTSEASAPVERASESVVSSDEANRAELPLGIGGFVSSGQIELPRDSLVAPDEVSAPLSSTPAASAPIPTSTFIANAMGRKPDTPLRTLVGVTAGIIFVLVVFSLLLFR